MRYAFDTGFFFALMHDPDRTVRAVWADLRNRDASGIVAGVVCFELRRHALVGRLDAAVVDALLDRLDTAFNLVWMDGLEDAERAAHLCHGEGLSMSDALVLRAALETHADRLYTNDRDLLRLDGFNSLEIVEV